MKHRLPPSKQLSFASYEFAQKKRVGVARMLHMYFLQQWFGLADEALEDTLYDSQSMRELSIFNQ